MLSALCTLEYAPGREPCLLQIGALFKPFKGPREALLWLIENQNNLYGRDESAIEGVMYDETH